MNAATTNSGSTATLTRSGDIQATPIVAASSGPADTTTGTPATTPAATTATPSATPAAGATDAAAAAAGGGEESLLPDTSMDQDLVSAAQGAINAGPLTVRQCGAQS